MIFILVYMLIRLDSFHILVAQRFLDRRTVEVYPGTISVSISADWSFHHYEAWHLIIEALIRQFL
jgi:hypothetical protein